MGEASASAHRLVRSGVFELDLRSGELRKSGARLNLQQQPLQLLSVLLEQPASLSRVKSSAGACGPTIPSSTLNTD